MKRFGALFLASILMLAALAACGAVVLNETFADGTYTAEFTEYDSFGYKEYVTVVVSDGLITQISYDAINAKGALRTQDADYERRMSDRMGTSPARYSQDLINQILQSQSPEAVDDIAGASWSSACFRALMAALKPAMLSGDTATVLVSNVPEK